MEAAPHATRSNACARLTALLAVELLLSAGLSRAVAAQEADSGGGTERSRVRVYVGMWSTHFRDLSRGLRQNWLVGLGWRGVYGGTFVNSFGNRSFTAGIQRTVTRGGDASMVHTFGYRLGLVSGYDDRLISIASRTPILPLVQVLGSVEAGRAGVDLGWAGLVGTIGPSFRF